MGIRELVNDDIAQLVEMVFTHKLNQNPDFPELQKEAIKHAFRNVLQQENSKALVYVNPEGLVAGYILFHLIHYPMIAGKEVYISDLLISENERGKGIGGYLLARAEQFAVENQCTRLMLNNPKKSEGYQRSFYKKHGFNERIAFANFVKMLN
jgi:GNAT superfamily N-acetyltransferase